MSSDDSSLILGNLVSRKKPAKKASGTQNNNNNNNNRNRGFPATTNKPNDRFSGDRREQSLSRRRSDNNNNNNDNNTVNQRASEQNRVNNRNGKRQNKERLNVQVVRNNDGQVRRSGLKFGPAQVSRSIQKTASITGNVLPPPPPSFSGNVDKTEAPTSANQRDPERRPGGDFTAAMSRLDSRQNNKQNRFQAKFSDRPNKSRPSPSSSSPIGYYKDTTQSFAFRTAGKSSNNKPGNGNDTNRARERQPNPKTSRLFDENIMDGVGDVETLKVEIKHEDLFSEKKFSELNLSNLVVAALQQRFSLETATQVQALTIPHLLEGRDALVKSATGSGKTLAYSIPMIEYLQGVIPKIDRTMGIHSLIILPTRELAIQTYDCIEKLLNPFRRIVLGILVGGEKKKSEKARIRKGMNILVTTPGRLLDHISSTETLLFDKLRWLVIDEADRLYEQGFSAMISQILEVIQNKANNSIQTVLLSATLTTGVKELAGLSLKNPAIIDVSDSEQKMEKIVLPTSLENCFMVVPAKLRLVILASILVRCVQSSEREFGSKIIVFMSCQDVVDYFSSLFNVTLNKLFGCDDDDDDDDTILGKNILNSDKNNNHKNDDNDDDDDDDDEKRKSHKTKKLLTVLQLRGNMKQEERTRTFRKFQSSKYGILFCTDVVSRGLDLPNVDLVVQMSCPSAIEDYVHRVGRTARVGCQGKSILFVLPSETRFLQHLQDNVCVNMTTVKVEEYFDSLNDLFKDRRHLHTEQERLAYLQHQFEDDVYADESLRKLATKSYLSHLRAYASYPRKMAYFMPFRELHIGHIAKSFALRESPSELGASAQQDRKRIKTKLGNTATMKRKLVPIEQMCSEFGGGVIGGSIKMKKQRVQ